MIDLRIPDWYDDANCRDADPRLFFPDGRGLGRRGKAELNEEALAICSVCEVRTTCLDYALTFEWIAAGIWGGTTENQRRVLLGKAPRETAQ